MTLLLFDITRDIVGSDRLTLPADANLTTVAGLRAWLTTTYPRLSGLRSLAIAVDREYADDAQPLDSSAEIALIPPVSGG